MNLKQIIRKFPLTIDLLPLILIASLSVLTYSGWELGGVVMKTDVSFPIYPWDEVMRYAHVWDPQFNMGFDASALEVHELPYALIIFILYSIGIPLWIVNRLAFMVPLFLLGFGSYYLARRFGGRLAGVSSAMIAIYNPYIFHVIQLGHTRNLFSASLFPFTLALFIEGLDLRGHASYRRAIYVGLLSILISSSNLVVLYAWVIMLSLYAVYHFIVGGDPPHTVKFSSAVIALFLVVNLWWFAPLLNQVFFAGESPYEVNMTILTQTSSRTNLWSTILMLDSGGYIRGYQHFWGYHLLLFTTTLASILVVAALVLVRRHKHVAYFGLLYAISVFLAKGLNPPLGEVYEWLFFNFPLFSIFRTVSHFLYITVLAYAFLFGLCISEIYSRLADRVRYWWIRGLVLTILVALVATTAVAGSYPKILDVNERITPAKIPQYYSESRQWMEAQDEDFKIFLPQPASGWLIKYKWTDYDMPTIDTYTSPKPVINLYDAKMHPTSSLSIIESAHFLFYDNRSGLFEKLLALMNVKYVVIHNDVDRNYITGEYPIVSSAQMAHFSSLYLERSFDGQVDFYRNKYLAPQIYASTRVIVAHGGLGEMLRILDEEDLTSLPAIFVERQLEREQLELIDALASSDPSTAPTVEFNRVNPSKYSVHIDHAAAPFLLVFCESYHESWVAYVNGEEVPSRCHLMTNGFANGWYIDKAGSYDITIEFWPSRLVLYGTIILTIGVLFSLAYSVWGDFWVRLRRVGASSKHGARSYPT